MSTNDSNILGLPPILPEPGFGSELTQMALTDAAHVGGGIGSINQASLQQRIVIDTVSSKSKHAMQRMVEMDQSAMSDFNSLAYAVNTINQMSHGTPYDIYINAFSDRLLKTSAKHLFGVLEIGAASIAREVYRPPSPGQPQGFLQRLLNKE